MDRFVQIIVTHSGRLDPDTFGRRARLVILFLICAAGAHAGDTGLRVGTITIVAEDVFSESEAASGTGYSWTNALHITTRPGVIRKFLLFREGDAFDEETLAQTERNLRQLPFLKSASVEASEPHDGVVDVTVVTQDSWSTEPGVSVGSSGGSSNFGFELTETNVLGSGREISVLYDKNADRSRRGVLLRDPAFFRPYWTAAALYTNNSDGVQSRLEVQRPFFSVETPWSVDVALDDLEQDEKIYAGSYETARFLRDHTRISAMYGVAVRRDTRSAQRLSLGFDAIQDEFRLPTADDLPFAMTAVDLPAPREFRYLVAQYQVLQNRWIKRQWVNRDMHVEDFNLGTNFVARVGVSPSAFGIERSSEHLALSLSRGATLPGDAFALGTLAAESRFGWDNRNAIVHGEGWIVRPRATAHPQTTVAHVKVDWGSELDPERQFFADGDSGLRGYRLHAFEGDRVAIVNLEHRVFLGRELWHLLSPGAAAFVDSAMVGREGAGWSDLKTDVGVGLRLGLSRAPRNLFRLDFAYAIDPDPRGERGFIVSFSSGQAF